MAITVSYMSGRTMPVSVYGGLSKLSPFLSRIVIMNTV